MKQRHWDINVPYRRRAALLGKRWVTQVSQPRLPVLPIPLRCRRHWQSRLRGVEVQSRQCGIWMRRKTVSIISSRSDVPFSLRTWPVPQVSARQGGRVFLEFRPSPQRAPCEGHGHLQNSRYFWSEELSSEKRPFSPKPDILILSLPHVFGGGWHFWEKGKWGNSSFVYLMDFSKLTSWFEPCSVGHNPYKVEAHGNPALETADINTHAKVNRI